MKTFLHKSLTKVFLLVVLFLSGCSTVDNMIHMVSGRTGTYHTDGVTYTFTISDDGETFTSYYTNADNEKVKRFTLGNMLSSSYHVEYDGWSDYTYRDVLLTDIGEFNGVIDKFTHNIHTGEKQVISIGFSWIIDYSD